MRAMSLHVLRPCDSGRCRVAQVLVVIVRRECRCHRSRTARDRGGDRALVLLLFRIDDILETLAASHYLCAMRTKRIEITKPWKPRLVNIRRVRLLFLSFSVEAEFYYSTETRDLSVFLTRRIRLAGRVCVSYSHCGATTTRKIGRNSLVQKLEMDIRFGGKSRQGGKSTT